MIELKLEGFELGLLPEAGGSVAWFRKDGVDILRPAAAPLGAAPAPLDMAAFPLIPFSGRIRNGAFIWNGRAIRLAANFPPEQHAIHGHGWQLGWEVTHIAPSAVTLQYRHEGGDWPWPYLAEQRFVLSRGGLSLDLSLTNLGEEAMPAGIGWHPYFPRGDARLSARLPYRWEPDETLVPVRRIDCEHGREAGFPGAIDGLDVDHPFEMEDGIFEIIWPERQLKLRLHTDDRLRFLILYVPPGQDFFCAEPASHVPDMVNLTAPARDTGLTRLEPGEQLRCSLSLWAETLPEMAENETSETERHAPVR
ncbi:MAG: aldose 1-epimerase [Hyphomonas sp.]